MSLTSREGDICARLEGVWEEAPGRSTDTHPGNARGCAQPEARRNLRRLAWLERGEMGHRERQRGKQQQPWEACRHDKGPGFYGLR